MLVFADGFDLYPATGSGGSINFPYANTGKWDAGDPLYNIGATIARFGRGKAAMLGSGARSLTKYVPNYATYILGWAVNYSPIPGGALVIFMDLANLQVELRLDAQNHFCFTRNGTLIGSASSQVIQAGWHYYEVKTTIHGSNGFAELRVDGAVALTLSGVNTQATTNAYTNRIAIYGGGSGAALDDIYICDNQGSLNNNYLGDVVIGAQMPNGAGSSTQFTANGAASNYACVNQSSPDEDTTYVSSSTPGQIDYYTIDALPAGTSTVFAVQQVTRGRKDDSGSRIIHQMLKSGGQVSESSDFSLSASYVDAIRILETDPNTGSQWSVSGANAIEIGEKEVS